MGQSNSGVLETGSLTRLEWVAVALAVVTGVIHVYAGLVEGRIPVTLAGVGFFGAVALYLLDYRRRLLALVGVVYTGVQLPLWYVAKAGEYPTIDYVDKAVQVVLIVLLAYIYWNKREATADRRTASEAD